MGNKYHDTYRIVTQVSRYVSHREICYGDSTIVKLYPMSLMLQRIE